MRILAKLVLILFLALPETLPASRTSSLSNHKKPNRLLKLLHTKKKLEKKNRKLFADAIAKLILMAGIRAFPMSIYAGDISSGNTNIAMSKEDPFVVINSYPVNQYKQPFDKDEITMRPPLSLI